MGNHRICPIKFLQRSVHDAFHQQTFTQPSRSAVMSKDQLLGEIRETNLAYLLLAQQMIRMDVASAMFRLGISQEVAEILERLSPGQIMKMAASNMLMCRFRCDDRTILGLLTDHNTSKPMMASHAAVLMAGQPAAGLA
jgi:flagellar transcriptional activator FlhD